MMRVKPVIISSTAGRKDSAVSSSSVCRLKRITLPAAGGRRAGECGQAGRLGQREQRQRPRKTSGRARAIPETMRDAGRDLFTMAFYPLCFSIVCLSQRWKIVCVNRLASRAGGALAMPDFPNLAFRHAVQRRYMAGCDTDHEPVSPTSTTTTRSR